MELYAEVLNFAIPFFIILILVEWLIGYFKGIQTNRVLDTISSLSSGMTNSIKDVLGLSIIIISYSWMVDKLAIFEIQNTAIVYLLAFIGLDFAGYWMHRFEHVVNIFWNRHIIHHSSEEFNLACALRQNISAIVAIFSFLYIPMAILGVPAEVVAIVAPIHLFAQFWYHTRLINKMGFLEHIIVTPSHHRVHHAINKEYLDKNFGQIFIFWDKCFGTFQEEIKEIQPVYGVKRQANTWNPILINYQHAWSLLKDAIRTKSWWDKLRIWFMPTGWRPKDMEEKFPIPYIDKAKDQKKYDTEAALWMKIWFGFQLVVHLSLMLYLFNHISDFGFNWILMYGLFLGISIFAYTSLMDGHWVGLVFEFVKLGMGLYLVYAVDGWYGIDGYLVGGTMIIISYLSISLINSILIYYFNVPKIRSSKIDVLEVQ